MSTGIPVLKLYSRRPLSLPGFRFLRTKTFTVSLQGFGPSSGGALHPHPNRVTNRPVPAAPLSGPCLGESRGPSCGAGVGAPEVLLSLAEGDTTRFVDAGAQGRRDPFPLRVVRRNAGLRPLGRGSAGAGVHGTETGPGGTRHRTETKGSGSCGVGPAVCSELPAPGPRGEGRRKAEGGTT